MGIIDGSFGAQGTALLVVLLDSGAFVVEMEGRVDIRGKDSGAEATGCTPGNSASEDKLHAAGASQVDMVSYDFLEEIAPGKGAVEDLGKADLELEDREVVVIACPSVFGGKGLRQHRHPAAEESLDVGSAELVTDLLHRGGIGGIEQAVIEGSERYTPFLKLALDPLMSIKPDPAGERGIGAQLDKRGAKIPVEDIEVVVVNTGAGAGEVVVGDAGGIAPGPVGAKGGCLLLSDADEYHSLPASGPLEVRPGNLLLSLSLLEMDDGNGMFLRKVFHGGGKVPGKTAQQCR
jgi:hypothetical protein